MTRRTKAKPIRWYRHSRHEPDDVANEATDDVTETPSRHEPDSVANQPAADVTLAQNQPCDNKVSGAAASNIDAGSDVTDVDARFKHTPGSATTDRETRYMYAYSSTSCDGLVLR